MEKGESDPYDDIPPLDAFGVDAVSDGAAGPAGLAAADSMIFGGLWA